LKNVA